MLSTLKKLTISYFIKLLEHEKVQYSVSTSIKQHLQSTYSGDNLNNPYHKSNSSDLNGQKPNQPAIFITGRFRSGSTLLWNIFRALPNCTAFYEPFNERQWFNSNLRGDTVDSTHIGVNDYWREYDGMDDLSSAYDEDWIRSGLHMDETTFAPRMKGYIDELISRSPTIPVLQFNRLDFRLPWLKHQYSDAYLIHLYRNPRDQFLSFLTDEKLMNKDDVESTYCDAFYLDVWSKDLEKHFPFLSKAVSPHPYQRFYYIWKLSFLYGKKYSNISIAYEELACDPKGVLTILFDKLSINVANWDDILKIVEPPVLNRWNKYAPSSWFSDIEKACETTLNSFISSSKSHYNIQMHKP